MKSKTNLLAAAIFAGALIDGLGQPIITRQPTNQSVSLGATASFRVTATTTNPPILFQWRFATTNLSAATNFSLTLTNIQSTNAGDYDAVLTDGSGSVTSQVAQLVVDPTFTKITSGDIVTDVGLSAGCTWGDYNNDGYLDLFVANNEEGANNFLYQNNGNGTFTKVLTGSIGTEGGDSIGCAWGDFDNDGLLDLFVDNGGRQTSLPSFLYHNNGNGDFTSITNATESKFSYNGVWGDYDNDGFVDLFLADNGGKKNALYHNNGGSSFMKITAGSPVNEGGNSIACAWGDFNNDGYLDLFVANLTKNFLYTNQGDGTFVKITSGSLPNDVGYSVGCAWGDYDNDGFPDLFVSNGGVDIQRNNFLYHNLGNGTFAKVTSGSIVTDVGNFLGCAWGDYDNDGFLDLFVCRSEG